MKLLSSILILAALLFNTKLNAQNFDANILRSVNTNRNQSLDNAFIFITNTGAPVAFGSSIITLGAGLIKKDKLLQEKGLEIFASVAISSTAGFLLKRMVNRSRPFADYAFIDPYKKDTDYSFPSNHTTAAFATATSLSINFKKWYVAVPAYTWAGLVGYSRMHLGVHYATDVFAGAILGSGTALITHKANQWLQKKKKKN